MKTTPTAPLAITKVPPIKTKRRTVVLLVIVSVLAALFFLIPSLLIRPATFEQKIKDLIQDQTGYLPSYSKVRFGFFPAPALHFDQLTLQDARAPDALPLLRADQADLRVSVPALLFGKIELAHASLKNAEVIYHFKDRLAGIEKTLALKGIVLDLGHVASGRPVRFKLRGKFLSDVENVTASGSVRIDFANPALDQAQGAVRFTLAPVDGTHLAEWWGRLPLHVTDGTLALKGEAEKPAGSSQIDFSLGLQLSGFIYQLSRHSEASAAGDYQAKAQGAFDFETGALILKDAFLTAPFGGPFDWHGKINLTEREIEELYLQTKALHLDAIPQHLLFLEKLVPVNLGFSGESQLDFFAKGDPAQLLLNARFDLTKTTLTYSKYFSKPAGVPLTGQAEVQLVGGRGLRGDFSAEFDQMNLKGSIVGMDLVEGKGEVTMITNKFAVNGWEKYLLPLRGFDLAGGIKLLASARGNFRQPGQVQVMGNISFDGLEARAANGAAIRRVNGLVDMSPMSSELKDFQFEIGGSTISVEGKMFERPNRRWLARARTPKIDLRAFAVESQKLLEAFQIGKGTDGPSVRESIERIIPPETWAENFHVESAYSAGQVTVPQLVFDLSGGRVAAQAVFDLSASPSSVVQLEANGINLARLGRSSGKQMVDGTLFAVATFQETGPLDQGWRGRLGGKGSFSVTNGEFHTFDILGGLGEIAELARLSSFRSGTTRFHDLHGDFRLKAEKLEAENLTCVSDDFQIEGAGHVDFAGNLNFRLSVYLLSQLAGNIIPQLEAGSKLGPIPLLITGTIDHPAVKADPMLVQTFLESLIRQQFSKITSRVLPVLGKRPASPTADQGEPVHQGQPVSATDVLVQSGFKLLDQMVSKKKE